MEVGLKTEYVMAADCGGAGFKQTKCLEKSDTRHLRKICWFTGRSNYDID